MLLVKFKSDWADEFDVSGFTIIPNKDWEYICEALKARFKARPNDEIGWGFGTNEGFDWKTYKEIMRCFSVQSIYTYEIKALQVFFGKDYNYYTSFGLIPFDSYKEQVLELVDIWQVGKLVMENKKFVWKDEKYEKNEKTT